MLVFAHLDPHTLEANLLDRIAAAKQSDPAAAVLVIVPSRRTADHLTRRLGERFGAALGIEILFHRALVARVLEGAGRTPPAPAGRLLLEALLDDVLRGLEEHHSLAGFVRGHAGASSSLLGSLVELREAGCTPAEVRGAAATDRERDLAAIYDAYASRLAALRGRGLADDAALAAEAVPHAGAFAARFARILHHGAYELVGVNLDLVRALDAGREIEFLLPCAPGRPVSDYAEKFARHFLLPATAGTIVPLDAPYASCLGDRLAAIYDEDARPAPLPRSCWSLTNTQGTATEFAWALRRAAAGVVAGTPAHETALIARTWSPYAAAIAETLADGKLACDAAPGLPLRREPLVRDTIAALRAVADDFPRAPTAELLRSPRIDWNAIAPGPTPVPGSLAEGWSRDAGIVGGLAAWTVDLPGWAATLHPRDDASEDERERQAEQARERGAAARRIAAAVSALAALVDAQARRGWRAHADAVAALAGRLYGDPGRAAAAARLIAPALDAARDRERLLGDLAPVPFAAFVAWLERAVDALPAAAPARPGAIAVVDAMQARGTTYARVHLAGLQSGLLPRVPREDAFVNDAFRERLREKTGRPLAIKLVAELEERLLLALALGAAAEHLDLSWPRADDDGRAKVASPALRELARVLLGVPQADTLRSEAIAVPSHPRERLEKLAAGTGLVTALEETALVALQAEGRAEGRAPLLARDPRLAPGLDLMAATESFAPGDGRFDGRVAPAGDRRWSVTALERLGRCALQFFFRDVLRVRPLAEEPSPFAASASEIGERVHALLESVYATLLAERAFARGDLAQLAARGEALVTSLWEEKIGASSQRVARALPGLHGIETRMWSEAVRGFVREDLLRMPQDGVIDLALEQSREGTIDAGEGVVARVRGRFDRLVRAGATTTVGDYKTSGDLEERVDPAALLKGRRLQVPLYRELAAGAEVELLGVGPSYDRSAETLSARRATFNGLPGPRQEEGLRETLRVLLRLPASGVYPIRPGRHCSFCDWRASCRHGHPPTVERHEHAADAADYRALENKTKTKPLIADHAGERGNGEES